MKKGRNQQRMLLIVLTLSMFLMIALASTILYHSERYSAVSEKLHKLTELTNKIVYYDEALTMSARMYSFRHDVHWLKRYENQVVKLDEALAEAIKIEPKINKAIQNTAEINRQLISLEAQSIAHVKNGEYKIAQGLLHSDQYLDLKISYSEQMEFAFSNIRMQSEALITKHDNQYQIFVLILTLLGMVFIVVWFYLLNFLRLNNQYLNDLITTDELTSLSNRRSFDEVLKRELHRSIRDEKTLMLAIIDIDYFKKYNDHYGHPKGDQVLGLFGKLIKRTLKRASDFGFRIGGEEFAIITVVETQQDGIASIKKVMRKLAAKKIEHEANPDSGIITVSVGVAYHHAEDIMTDEELYIAADKALYKAKEQGRNQLVEYSTELKS